MNDRVDIIMSVFNGELYLSEMLASIRGQTYSNWHLIIRNNGSTDSTHMIIDEFVRKNPGKVTLINANSNEKFIPVSFGNALSFSSAEYSMFADGDDVWLPKKIEYSLNAILVAERKHGKHMPLLVHSDLILTNAKLQTIENSMWKSQVLNPERQSLNYVIMHSNACGNTFLFNRALRDLISPIPYQCIMHDYWTSCIAACFGKIVALPDPQILYRQHGNNSCGAHALSFSEIFKKMRNGGIRQRLKDKYRLSELLLERFRCRLSVDKIELLEVLASFPEMSWVSKRIAIFKYSLYMNSWKRTFALLLLA